MRSHLMAKAANEEGEKDDGDDDRPFAITKLR
jgi:hypothetical protein